MCAIERNLIFKRSIVDVKWPQCIDTWTLPLLLRLIHYVLVWFFWWESTFCIVIWLDMEILNLEKLINGYKAVELTF